MTSIQWIIGENEDKAVFVLSVHRDLEEMAALEELKYREAIKSIKGIRQLSFDWFKHQYGPSLSVGDRLYVNNMHYFAFETGLDGKNHVLEQIRRQNEKFKEHIYVDKQVPLEKHSVSKLIALYRIKESP
jgi:hypothetical protein